ncbi:MAG: hypothetical protein AAGC55_30860 [Myxococcota bacterium]
MSRSSKPPLPDKVTALVRATLNQPGVTAPDLRSAVEAQAATLSGGERPAAEVPTELDSYVSKVARHAYKVTDDDIAALRGNGYSEDAIFEITVSAAVGASVARLERALEAIDSAATRPRTAAEHEE